MTNKLKTKLLLLFLGALTFTFFNCEFDEKANTLEKESLISKNFTVKNLHFEEISTNKQLLNKLKTLEGKKEISNIGNRIVYSGENDFYIDTNYVKYIERENGKHSYTFLLKRDSTNVLLENLVLSLNLNGDYDLHIVQYDINQYELEQLKIGQSSDLSNKTTVLQIEDNTLISNIFSKVVIINEGEGDCLLDVNFIAATNCGCDGHSYGESCTCDTKATPDQWVYTWGDCGDGGGGGSGSDSSSGGGGGGSGSSNNDDGSSIENNCRGCGGNEIDTAPLPELEEEILEETPCEKLNKLWGLPINPNVKSIIQNHLQTDIAINPNGEKGAYLTKDVNDNYTRAILPATSTNQIGIPTASIIPGIFCVFHTHPNNAYPMFSWSDVYALYSINQDIDTHNQGLATFLLTCDVTGNGNYETYAIVFNNSTADIIDMILNNPFYNGMDKQKIAAEKDNELAAKYVTESKNGTNNYERAFLQQMIGTNVDIYKANSSLDNWSKLRLNQFTNNVQDIPCN